MTKKVEETTTEDLLAFMTANEAYKLNNEQLIEQLYQPIYKDWTRTCERLALARILEWIEEQKAEREAGCQRQSLP